MSYWNSRKTNLYYQAVYQFVSVVGDDAESILDVGSAETDYINWFDWIPQRTQLNLGFRHAAPQGVNRIRADFFKWDPPHKFDVVLCLQVLEHVVEAGTFCDRLKATARQLIISVPYKWKKGAHDAHVHDPVDEDKLFGWMGRRPNHARIVHEPFGPRRLIAWYDLEGGENARIAPGAAKDRKARRA